VANSDLRIHAHAKINLFLDVIGKRSDGYHEIVTVFHSIGLHDDVIIRKRSEVGITVHCDNPQVPLDARNLAHRAAKLLIDQRLDIPGVVINIQKRIPVAGGLGGGSTNAAAVLWGMNQLFELNLTQPELMRLGARLGADIPFCLLGGSAIGRGIGENLAPLPPLANAWIVLANPGFGISTAWVYENICFPLTKPSKSVKILIRQLRNGELKSTAVQLYNRLETPVYSKYPSVGELKTQLARCPGSYGALMSGSGATVFALVENQSKADSALSNLGDEATFGVVTTVSPVGLCLA
jgi:4-diphosphocytidyl-2-C-methyl-D-erythritol kinase